MAPPVSIRRLQLLFAAYGIALGFTLPWNVPQLTEAGLDPGEVGAVLGLAALLSLVGYPVWGLIADTLLGRDRTLILAATLAALSGVGIVVSGDQPGWLAAFIVLQLVCVAPWAPIADALALGELGTQARAYGRVRSVTSAGWVVAVLIAGAIATAAGLGPVRALFVVTALGLAAAVAARRSPRSLLRRPERRTASERLTWSAFRSALRASPVFVPFLGVLLIASIATNASYAFISLRILDEGGGPMLIALAAAMPAIVEVPMFTLLGRLSDRFGLRTLYVAGTLLSGVQMLIIAAAPVPIVIALVRLIDGAGFALRYSSIVLIAGAALPDRLRATGQSMASLMTSGIAPVVSGPVGGWVYGSFGGTALFVACSAVLLASSALAYVVLAPLAAARRALTPAAAPPDG
jgi:PPP family 3-phenylpropionic acid transporter